MIIISNHEVNCEMKQTERFVFLHWLELLGCILTVIQM